MTDEIKNATEEKPVKEKKPRVKKTLESEMLDLEKLQEQIKRLQDRIKVKRDNVKEATNAEKAKIKNDFFNEIIKVLGLDFNFDNVIAEIEAELKSKTETEKNQESEFQKRNRLIKAKTDEILAMVQEIKSRVNMVEAIQKAWRKPEEGKISYADLRKEIASLLKLAEDQRKTFKEVCRFN